MSHGKFHSGFLLLTCVMRGFIHCGNDYFKLENVKFCIQYVLLMFYSFFPGNFTQL